MHNAYFLLPLSCRKCGSQTELPFGDDAAGIAFLESSQSVNVQWYSLQGGRACDFLFHFFIASDQWWLVFCDGVLFTCFLFPQLKHKWILFKWLCQEALNAGRSKKRERSQRERSQGNEDESEGHLTLLAVRTIYLKVYLINVLLAKAAEVPVLWTLGRTDMRIWRWEGGCFALSIRKLSKHIVIVKTSEGGYS